jgi:hypothetical protein
MPQVDQFSFVVGFIVGFIVCWALGQVLSWLGGIFKPPAGKPIRQRIAEGVRKLIASLLVLAALAVMGYIVYSVLVKPTP